MLRWNVDLRKLKSHIELGLFNTHKYDEDKSIGSIIMPYAWENDIVVHQGSYDIHRTDERYNLIYHTDNPIIYYKDWIITSTPLGRYHAGWGVDEIPDVVFTYFQDNRIPRISLCSNSESNHKELVKYFFDTYIIER